MDYSTILGSVDFSAVLTAIAGAAGAIGLVLVGKKGARMVLSFFGR